MAIPVFNAPFSNTRSVAELVLGQIIMLMRGIFPKSAAAHRGEWIKSAANSWEVRGKTLGIVGYGNIGAQLSVLAESLGMHVIYYDPTPKLPLGRAEAYPSLAALLAQADVVSLHVPDTKATRWMIGAAQIRAMRPGAFLINASRGRVVDVEALAAAIRDGHLLGAAADVFPDEPSSTREEFLSPLRGLPNVILTPHIGGSTAEAQERIGHEVARKLIDYSDIGSTFGAVNFPQVAAAGAAAGDPLHPRPPQHAGPARPGHRRLQPPRPQYRRAVPADRRRARLRRRRHRRRCRGGAGDPGRPARRSRARSGRACSTSGPERWPDGQGAEAGHGWGGPACTRRRRRRLHAGGAAGARRNTRPQCRCGLTRRLGVTRRRDAAPSVRRPAVTTPSRNPGRCRPGSDYASFAACDPHLRCVRVRERVPPNACALVPLESRTPCHRESQHTAMP